MKALTVDVLGIYQRMDLDARAKDTHPDNTQVENGWCRVTHDGQRYEGKPRNTLMCWLQPVVRVKEAGNDVTQKHGHIYKHTSLKFSSCKSAPCINIGISGISISQERMHQRWSTATGRQSSSSWWWLGKMSKKRVIRSLSMRCEGNIWCIFLSIRHDNSKPDNDLKCALSCFPILTSFH